MKKEKIKENIFKVLLLVFFGAMMIFFISGTEDGIKLGLIMFGLFFILMGSKAVKDSLFGLLFLLAGIGISLGTIFFGYGYKIFEVNKDILIEEYLPPVLVSIFIIVGLSFIFIPIIIRKISAKKYTIHIYGKVVDLKKSYNYTSNRRHTIYLPTYEYYFNSQFYRVDNDIWTNIDVPKLGETVDIYINPENPSDFYRKNSSKTNLFFMFFGFSFLILGIFAEYCIFFL